MPVYCYRCDRRFPQDRALAQHERDSPNHRIYCRLCDIDLSSSAALRKHNKRKHFYCDTCDLLFDDSDDFLEHGEDEHFACSPCIRIFTTFNGYACHSESAHHYCRECNRLFQSENTLRIHRASSIHTPRWLACPGRQCIKKFTCPSALIHHAESGACPSGVTRKAVNEYVARQDRQNIITNASRMLTGPDGEKCPPSEPNYLATQLSWNGKRYECFLCHGQYATQAGLNQHLKSPRHLQDVYHCPMRNCEMEFTVLSALCQHAEMGSCGIRESRMAKSAMEYLERGMRALSL
ncbi:uncharacterized protein FOMMEDRAFT_93335 [Fomitiporia mediterranea MF3/22]|uniref:uncharacterized protein n=1 Tax=Fomitiporia mediterranea (strain MF3/22) TaxID=694068 RepID=UPI00044094BE|nr:uncharacterized protein FOMMEDRAFT_93335 [Fomitiporia mediterranea MF3/22]EJC99647.1 hypothetical protein FOMMEDRAFT_93335 [Fomitiporia mediterranea MF3/22]